MTFEWDWETGEGLLNINEPSEVDAAFERGADHLGTAVIGLAFHCSLQQASPRIIRAMRLSDPAQRGFAYTAAGAAARLNGELTPELFAALRAESPGGIAEHPIRDVLAFVPFRNLPPWFKRRWVYMMVRNKLEGWWLRTEDAIESAWRALRGRRS
ncbi:hypothetical protein [Streptomyces olivaceus]|uniref:hypothetical protein n=1 Tax=Streptomyces olivaceus TaxID=47716 RepID=UPI001CC91373|nr:hypothetical protein [Streptomyces olivaceus]MBZ6228457.1 hypothetical protein [Streptomyces olivaceus]